MRAKPLTLHLKIFPLVYEIRDHLTMPHRDRRDSGYLAPHVAFKFLKSPTLIVPLHDNCDRDVD